jgi:hypothetical protein
MRRSSLFQFCFVAALSANAWAFQQKYPDYLDQVPPVYAGDTFRLNQDYPTSANPEPNQPWLTIDFRKQPDEYMFAVRKYVFEGMMDADWRPEKNALRSWYHVPWMHVGRHPREFIRGMTRERNSEPGELGPKQVNRVQNWAVGFYNPLGGYTIGKVWDDPKKPKPELSQFPIGTVAAKILFTAATTDEVPELDGTIEWDANINSEFDETSPKAIRKVRLLQMDVAIRDVRADSATGWIFGTFVYDKTANGANGWEKLMPVGLMWGNDPGIKPSDVAAGKTLRESKVSALIPSIAQSRLGWAGRVNGPVDNKASACLSCHGTSQWRPLSSLAPRGTDDERLRWFRNLKPNQAFDKDQIPLDYSLQMAVALQNYFNPTINAAIFPSSSALRLYSPEAPRDKSKVPTDVFDLGFPVER